MAEDPIARLDAAIATDPDNYTLWNNRGVRKLARGLIDAAIQDFSKAVDLWPAYQDAIYNRGVARIKERNFKAAVEDLSRAIELKRDDYRAWSSRADAKEGLGDFKAAIEDASKGLELKPDYEVAWNNRGFCKKAIGDLEGAINDYSQAIEVNKNFHIAWHNRGSCKLARKEIKSAVDDFDRAVEIKPEFGFSWANKALVKISQGDQAGALEDLNQGLKFDPECYHLWYLRGDVKTNLGDQAGALEDFSKAASINPTFQESHFRQGFLKSKIGDHQGAILELSRSIDLKKDHRSSFIQRAFVRGEIGDVAGAVDDYTKAIELNPNQFVLWNNRALGKISLGDHKGAIEDLSKSIELKPDSFACWLNRAQCKSRIGDFRGAIEDYKMALLLKPDLGSAWNGKADAHRSLKEHSLAVADYSKAIDLKPDNYDTYITRGLSKCDGGDIAGALEDLNKAAELKTDYHLNFAYRGYVRNIMGEFEAAIQECSKAIQLNPLCTKAYNNRGYAHYMTKNIRDAIGDFGRACEISPTFYEAFKNRAVVMRDFGDLKSVSEDLIKAQQIKSQSDELLNYVASNILREESNVDGKEKQLLRSTSDNLALTVSGANLNSEVANLIMHRSNECWTNVEEFSKDMKVVIDQFMSLNSSSNLLSAMVASLWLHINIVLCKQVRANEMWRKFSSVVEKGASQCIPESAPAEVDLTTMKQSLQGFFKLLEEKNPPDLLKQAVPEDFKTVTSDDDDEIAEQQKKLAERLVINAKGYLDAYKKMVAKVDKKAVVGVKSSTRAFEKAEKDYAGDVTRVLDYLRGLVHVRVDSSDTPETISERYQRATKHVSKYIVRLKMFPESPENSLPRVLLNLGWKNMITELQVHFQFLGFNEEYQMFMHTMYELTRKDLVKANEQEHVSELTLDLLSSLGIELSEKSIKPDVTEQVVVQMKEDNEVFIEIRKIDKEPEISSYLIEKERDADGDPIKRYKFTPSRNTKSMSPTSSASDMEEKES